MENDGWNIFYELSLGLYQELCLAYDENRQVILNF